MYKILIEEDDESIREELAALLRVNGYIPVDKPPCDLALLDVNLPGESGFERRTKSSGSAWARTIISASRTTRRCF